MNNLDFIVMPHVFETVSVDGEGDHVSAVEVSDDDALEEK